MAIKNSITNLNIRIKILFRNSFQSPLYCNTTSRLLHHIWYACYGSNLLEERFLCYIKGGTPYSSSKYYEGCRDKTLPLENEEFYICSKLYFAKSSSIWQGAGVAFIKTNFDPTQNTIGRMYLITREQFIDVVKQEINSDEIPNIDFAKAIKDGSTIFKQRSWYGNIIYLGTQDDYPIFTFTNQENLAEINKPSEEYLTTIIKGIKEIIPACGPNDILEYLISTEGINIKMIY